MASKLCTDDQTIIDRGAKCDPYEEFPERLGYDVHGIETALGVKEVLCARLDMN